MPETRPWELWDQPGVTPWIDGYWTRDAAENAHRANLARQVKVVAKRKDKILDVGCGTGLLYPHLVPAILEPGSYRGVDVSESMLAIARARHPGVPFERGDAVALGVPDGSTELVASFEMLQHLPEIDKPIAEMVRAASRAVFFTVPLAVKTTRGQETVQGATFIRTAYSSRDVLAALAKAGGWDRKTYITSMRHGGAYLFTVLKAK